MNYEQFMKLSGLTVRKSYYDSAVIHIYNTSGGLSEQDFCERFPDIVAELTGARTITVSDVGTRVITDDFYQLHEIRGDTCTLAELLNSCDDTQGN